MIDNAVETVATLKAGRVSHGALIEELAQRRHTFDGLLHAFIHTQGKVTDPGQALPLAGLPISIKDQIHVAGMPCSFGLAAKRPFMPLATAAPVQSLIRAGASIIGKTSLPPLAMDFQTSNDLVGITCNPWNRKYTAGGSSGGGAAAVASGMSFIDIGADLAGSLRIPAAYCGVCSLVPTQGALPGEHMLMGGDGALDHFARMGPIARTIDDLALAWKHMQPSPEQDVTMGPTSSIRLAVSTGQGILPVDSRITEVFERAIGVFRLQEISIEDVLPPVLLSSKSWHAYGMIMGYETSALMRPIERFMARKFGAGTARQSPRFLAPVHAGYRRDKGAYAAALDVRRDLKLHFDGFMDDYDALLLPVSCVAAFPHRTPSSRHGPVRNYNEPFVIGAKAVNYLDAMTGFTTPVSLIGNPVVTIPLGLDHLGLPVGAQLIGKSGCEGQLLALARRLLSQLPVIEHTVGGRECFSNT